MPPRRFHDHHHKGFQGLDQAFSNAWNSMVSLPKRLPEELKSEPQQRIPAAGRHKKPVALFHALR
jgi:hypothetical protein